MNYDFIIAETEKLIRDFEEILIDGDWIDEWFNDMDLENQGELI